MTFVKLQGLIPDKQNMIVLPLGLRAKLYIKPWATIAIAVVTIGFSIRGLYGQKGLEEFKKHSFLAHDIYNLSYLAIKNDCKTSFAEVVCTFFEGYVKAEDLAQTDLMLEKIEKFEAFDRPTKEKIKYYIQNLPKNINQKNEAFTKAAVSVSQEVAQYYSEHNLLSPENMNWQSLAVAPWLHQNWWTLLVNLLILGLFSCFLEQRIGAGFLFVLYTLGSLVSVVLQVNFANSYQWVSGGMTGVMAILGSYGVFFFKEKIRIYLNLFLFYEKKLTIPGWLYIALFFVAGNALLSDSDVTPNLILYSHLFAFSFGMVSGVLFSLVVWVQKDFLFEAEQNAYFKAKKTTQPLKKITHCLELLEINPYNFTGVEYLIKSLSKYRIESSDVPDNDLKRIGILVVRLMNGDFRVEPSQAYAIISLLPLTWNLTLVPMPRLEKKELSKIENGILENDWRLAFRFYDLYLAQHPSPRVKEEILATIQKLIVQAESPMNPEYHQNMEWLRVYVMFSGKTAICQLLADKYEDKTAAG